jgi:hypothetical protein
MVSAVFLPLNFSAGRIFQPLKSCQCSSHSYNIEDVRAENPDRPHISKLRDLLVIVKPRLKLRNSGIDGIAVTACDSQCSELPESDLVLVDLVLTRALQKVKTAELRSVKLRSVPFLKLSKENGYILATKGKRLIKEIEECAADHVVVDNTVVLRAGSNCDGDGLVLEIVKEFLDTCFDCVGRLLVDSTFVRARFSAGPVEELCVFVGITDDR